MIAVQAGDEGALGSLMSRYQGPLYGFLVRRVGDAADDVFQETWIGIVRARERFDPTRRFSTWMFQIANNLCRDRYRRQAVRTRTLQAVRAEHQTLGQLAAPPPDPDAGHAMRSHVAALPERLREVLLLRYYQDLGEAEISQVLGIPRGTVKSRLHAAVKALRERVQTEGARGD